MASKRFFISYAHGPAQGLADFFYDGLKGAGHEAFMDRDIPLGAPWSQWIETRLAECDFVVVLLSAESVASDMVLEEVSLAHQRLRKTGSPRLFPVRVGYDKPLEYDLSAYLRRYQSKTWRTALDSDRLLEEILAVVAGSLPAPGPAVRTAAHDDTWQILLERSRQQCERFLNEASSGRDQAALFIPEVYVRREIAEQSLNEFLEGNALGIVLVGDSGVGKTNLLCQWTLDLRQAGHGVFYYACSGSLGLEIDREIAQDLAPEDPEPLLNSLQRVERLAVREGRHFVLIFDGVEEFRDGSETGPEALLKRIDSLLGHLPGTNVRVALSCGAAAWNRLQRLDALHLYWSRYAGNTPLQLGSFAPAEFQSAYPRYQARFDLRTPFEALSPARRNRLRHPLLLRMWAEAYRGRDEPITDQTLALVVYRRYYEQRVRRRRDELFVDRVVAEMLQQRQAALPLSALIRHPELGAEILSDQPDSSYQQLLDSGVLTENPGDLIAGESTLRFTHVQVGAYSLARHLRRESDNGETLANLVAKVETFPLAWDAARMWLLLGEDFTAFAAAAGAADSELRELAAETLAELYVDQPLQAVDWLKKLLESDSKEAGRTALRAAYYATSRPGSDAGEVFLWAAQSQSPSLRQAAKDALYLIWRKNPEFAYDTLHALLKRMTLGNLFHLRRILEFVIDLSITIYVNHCECAGVIERTDRLYHELATRRLHLKLFNTGFLGPKFEKLVIGAFAAAFAQPILDTMLFSELVPADRFFKLPWEQRALLQEVAPLLDPDSELEPARERLAGMLQSDVPFFNVVAALILAIHACSDFPRTRPLLGELFEALDGRGRLWELLSFSVLLPGTPPEWIGLLEEFTRRLVRERPDMFHGGELGRFDIVFVPLGLAYGKRGAAMPLFTELIRQAIQDHDQRLLARCLRALGPVGFYYPKAVLATLRQAIPDDRGEVLQQALLRPLAIMRTLHFDDVDRFMQRLGVDEGFQRRVAAEADLELVHRYIYWLGLYNNAAHFSRFYPKMRRALSMGALQSMAKARTPIDFVADYTTTALRMFRESGFRLREWTYPD